MDDLDKANFGTQLTHFGRIHKTKIEPALIRAYWEDLCHMTRPEFDRACTELRKASQWMPKPAEFWRAARRGWT